LTSSPSDQAYATPPIYITSIILSPSPTNSPHLHSFPTRRSSDLPLFPPPDEWTWRDRQVTQRCEQHTAPRLQGASRTCPGSAKQDRKSTRLNSSHGSISYAVFCVNTKDRLKLQPQR